MKEYRAPSFPKDKEKRSGNPDRRKDSLLNAIQPITQAFINYLEAMSESMEQRIEAETKNEHHKKVREIILKIQKNNKTYLAITDQLEKNSIPTFSGWGNGIHKQCKI